MIQPWTDLFEAGVSSKEKQAPFPSIYLIPQSTWNTEDPETLPHSPHSNEVQGPWGSERGQKTAAPPITSEEIINLVIFVSLMSTEFYISYRICISMLPFNPPIAREEGYRTFIHR